MHNIIFKEDQACINSFNPAVLDRHYKSDEDTKADDPSISVNINSSNNKNINGSPTSYPQATNSQHLSISAHQLLLVHQH